jgi:hypothetical protein
LKYHEGLVSDHRGMFCDLHSDVFTNVTNFNGLKTRQIGLNSTNKESEKCMFYLDYLFGNHKIYEKLNNLYKPCKLKDEKGEILNKEDILCKIIVVDQIITESMLSSKHRCCKPKEVTYWTPEMYQSTLLIQYYNLMIKYKHKLTTIEHRLKYLVSKMIQLTKTKITMSTGSNREILRKHLIEHRKLINNNVELREKYLALLAQDLEERDPRAKVTVESIKARERNKNDFKVIMTLLKGNQGAGIRHIEVPDERKPTIWRILQIR